MGKSEGEYADGSVPDDGGAMAATACCVDVAACSMACMRYRPSGLRSLGTALDHVEFLDSEVGTAAPPSAFIAFDGGSALDGGSSLSPFVFLCRRRITPRTGG